MLSMIEQKQTRMINLLSYIKANSTKLAGINIYGFFLLLFIYHVLLVFQGIDMLDEGFHVSSYQQIFNDPESVQYTFLYWLSNIIGGSFIKLFPDSGLLGIRIAGAIISTSTIIIAYQILKKHISPGTLKLSLILLALFINNDPKNLYYNNLSAFFYIIAAYFLYTGLASKKNLSLFLSGLFIGINVFTRLPNLLGLGISLIIFYYGFCNQQSLKLQFTNFLIFAFGSVAGILLIFLLMYSLGHLPLFINSIKQLFSISSGATETDGLNGSYGILNIPVQLLKQYAGSIGLILNIFSFILLSSLLLNLTNPSHKFLKACLLFLIICFASYFSISLIKQGILNYKLIDLFTGLSLVASFFILLKEKNNELKLLSMIGTFILLVHPFGSAVGIYTVAPYSLWLIFPFAIALLSKTKQLLINLSFSKENNNSDITVFLSGNNIRLIKFSGLIIIVLTCLNQIIRYPYFYDQHNRLEMTSSVDNKYMKGIFTSRGRAETINELLQESSKYINPNDYVLAYDLIPMYHYWTETRPYVRSPCPWFYSPALFKQELDLAVTTKKALPVIVMQSIKTIGDGSKWPEEMLSENYSNWERNKGRNTILTDFLLEHSYTLAWENKVFKILLPPDKNRF